MDLECEICGSHGGDCEGGHLLGCGAVQSHRSVLVLQRNLQLPTLW